MENALADNEIRFEDWWEQYRPVGNPVEGSGPRVGDHSRMFETYGKDLETVRAATFDDRTAYNVWTLGTDDDDELVITPGCTFVNRLGYYITEVPFTAKDYARGLTVVGL